MQFKQPATAKARAPTHVANSNQATLFNRRSSKQCLPTQTDGQTLQGSWLVVNPQSTSQESAENNEYYSNCTHQLNNYSKLLFKKEVTQNTTITQMPSQKQATNAETNV